MNRIIVSEGLSRHPESSRPYHNRTLPVYKIYILINHSRGDGQYPEGEEQIAFLFDPWASGIKLQKWFSVHSFQIR
jgi:hypothetical protein